MDIITIVLIIAGILATVCVLGMVRNWNTSTGATKDSGPQIQLTLVGWILAILAAGVACSYIILAWQAGWLPPAMLRGPSRAGVVALSFAAGLVSFYVPALILHLLGIRAWRVKEPRPGEASSMETKPRPVRFRPEDKKPDDRGRSSP